MVIFQSHFSPLNKSLAPRRHQAPTPIFSGDSVDSYDVRHTEQRKKQIATQADKLQNSTDKSVLDFPFLVVMMIAPF